jgi:hypothetical protein
VIFVVLIAVLARTWKKGPSLREVVEFRHLGAIFYTELLPSHNGQDICQVVPLTIWQYFFELQAPNRAINLIAVLLHLPTRAEARHGPQRPQFTEPL